MPKLANGRPRAELIASYPYGVVQAAAAPPPAPADAPTDATTDQGCPRCGEAPGQGDRFCSKCGQKLDGQDAPADAKQPPAPAATAAGPPAPEGSATAPKTNPVDEDGNVDGNHKCANPDCQHLASSHVDTPDGQNTGGCSMANCNCEGMQVEAQPNTGKGDASGPDTGNQGAEPSSGSQELANAPAVPDGPVPPGAPATAATPELNAPPQTPGGENVGPAFTIPVLVIEGQPTGDGRQIAPSALTWRTPPLPLMGLDTSTHDPEGWDQNDPAVICGRIDSLERQPGEGDTQVIIAKGFYLANDDGQHFADLNEQMGRLGISADVAVQQTEVTAGEIDDDGWPTDMTMTVLEGTIMAATVCPMPAFEGAYIVLGDGEAQPDAIAQASEPVTAAGIHWMTYAECEPCQQGLEVIVASGAGPTAPPASWFEDPNFHPDDGRLVEILDRRGQRQVGGKYACPITVTDDGRVFGHLAPWGVCHIGKPGCVTAPESKTDYAYFKRGQHLITAEGEQVRVGTLTINAGHADMHSDPASAMAHYDNIATGVADVNVGQDEFGIWLAGAIRPTATQEQIAALRASSISGDWRGMGGSLELVAALAVPVPGFPHAVVAAGEQEALVASGASVMHRLKHPLTPEAEGGDVALRHALAPLLASSRENARGRISALR